MQTYVLQIFLFYNVFVNVIPDEQNIRIYLPQSQSLLRPVESESENFL